MNSNNKIRLTLLTIGTILFNYLFWGESLGINLFIFNLFVLGSTFIQNRHLIQNKGALALSIGSVILSFFILYHNSGMSKFTFFCTIITFVGYSHGEKIKALPYAYFESVLNYFAWIPRLVHTLRINVTDKRNTYFQKFLRRLKLILIPIIITTIFYFIFQSSNLIFAEFTLKWENQLIHWFENFFTNFSFLRVGFFIWGISITGWIVFKSKESFMAKKESLLQDDVVKGQSSFRSFVGNIVDINMVSLTNENKMGVVMLIMVNILLLVVNCIDVIWIWFKFDPTEIEQFTQFVHEGTYLLILSVILSMVILLHLFRKNQNFYPKSNFLKKLGLIWVIQNTILVISVGLRNYHYIHEYGLAYKRIGVFFFLFATIAGLFTMHKKIKEKKSSYFLVKRNAWIVYGCFIVMSTFNWDAIILDYNLSKNKSVAFLYNASDKILPKLSEIDLSSYQIITQGNTVLMGQHLSSTLKNNKNNFMAGYNRNSWLSWNYADYKTYQYFKEN